MLITDAGHLSRLINCNGSRLLSADPIRAERDTTIRDEGIAAHWLASVAIRGEYTIEEQTDRKAPNGVYITPEMAEHVHDYLSVIFRSPGIRVFNEYSYSINGPDWQINGRPDMVGLTNYALFIDDFKYGYQIVEPEDNWTLISHAIGVCLSMQIQPQTIVFTIHQPRAPHHDGRVRQHEISYNKLTMLYADLCNKIGNLSSMLQTGPHCYKCPSFIGCVARQKSDLNAIEVAHATYSAEISDEDLSARLLLIERAQDMLKQAEKAYKEEGLHRVINGRVIQHYAMEDGLGNRVWRDNVTPDLLRVLSGVNEVTEKPKMISPAQAEKANINENIVAYLTYRPVKGKRLVRINANKRAEKAFGKKGSGQ